MGPLIHFKSSITTLSISFIIIMCISFFSKVSNHKLTHQAYGTTMNIRLIPLEKLSFFLFLLLRETDQVLAHKGEKKNQEKKSESNFIHTQTLILHRVVHIFFFLVLSFPGTFCLPAVAKFR